VSHRYVARREFFGALIYDSKTGVYLPFDADAVEFFESGKLPRPKSETKHKSHVAFVESCRSRGLIDGDNRFPHPWVDTVPRLGYLSAPTKLSLNITSQCNLRCKHCYLAAAPEMTTALTYIQALELLEQMVANGIFLLSIKGGEPFVHKDLLRVLAAATERNIRVSLVTNGTRITATTARALNDTSVAYLSVSLDGADPASNDLVRGRGTFARVVRGIDLLKRHFRGAVYLNITLNQLNVGQVPAMFRLAEDLGCDGLRFRPILPARRAVQEQQLLLTGELYRQAVRDILAISASTQTTVEVFEADIAGQCNFTSGLYTTPGCAAANTYAHVSSTGELYPCEYLEMPEFRAGNVLASTIGVLWEKSEVLRRFRRVPANEQCNACNRYKQCRGGCRARVVLHGDDLHARDPWCTGPA